MKTVAIITLQAIFLFSCNQRFQSQESKKKAEESAIFKEHNIQYTKTYLYTYELGEESQNLMSLSEYDRDGFLIRDEVYFEEDDFTKQSFYAITYEYDNTGNFLNSKKTDETGVVLLSIEYEYKHGKNVARIYNNYDTTENDYKCLKAYPKYDDKGFLLEVDYYLEPYQWNYKGYYAYNEKGELLEETMCYANDEIFFSDKLIAPDEWLTIDVLDGIENRRKDSYDSNNRVIKQEITHTKENEETKKRIIEYTYNDAGLMLDMIVYDGNEKLEKILRTEYIPFAP